MPPEADLVPGACWHLLVATIDHPLPSIGFLIGPLDPDVLGRVGHRGVDGLILALLIYAQAEKLATGLANFDGGGVPATPLADHRLLPCVTAPRAADVDGAGLDQILLGLVQRRFPPISVLALIGDAGDVVWSPLLSQNIGLVLLLAAERACHGLTCEVLDGTKGDRADRVDLVECLHADGTLIELPHLVGSTLALAPYVGSRVRATETEGGDPCVVAVQVGVDMLRFEYGWEAVGIQMRIQLGEVDVCMALGAGHHINALEQAGDASGGFQVTDVALRARRKQRSRPRLHRTTQRTDLDRVSKCRPSAVALCHGDLAGHHTGLPHRLGDALPLCHPVRCSQGSTPPVLIDLATHQACELGHVVIGGIAAYQVH
mmetsp:Transcript_28756/g.61080  ORF Transcript_28756/g.61080 Transcript_28756/m.61080 type:complete len:374 (+) Transcript_28756:885-2006(+)